MSRPLLRRLLRPALFVTVLVGVCALWARPVAAAAVVLVACTGIVALEAERRGLLVRMFVVGAVAGPVAETAAIESGAWSYATHQIGPVPLWLSPTWGAAALFFTLAALRLADRRD